MRKPFFGLVQVFIVSVLVLISCQHKTSQTKRAGNVALVDSGVSLKEIVRIAAQVRPSPRQYAWQRLEFIAFVHFSLNTFPIVSGGRAAKIPVCLIPRHLTLNSGCVFLKRQE